jgi:predicted DNA-binding transcriptional regulator YafY
MTATRATAKAIRLTKIPDMLRDRPRTVNELAERFGVSERAIRDDLHVLQGEEFYLPIVCEVFWCLRKPDAETANG